MSAPPGSAHSRCWLLESGTTFLNHGSFGACPIALLERQGEISAEMEAQPVRFLARQFFDRLDEARVELGEFLGCSAEDLAFVPNATTGVNTVLQSFPLYPGDEIITTDHDYNACRNALNEISYRTGANIRIARVPFPLRSADQVLAAVLATVTDKTKLVVLDHITSPTALIFPIERLVVEIEARGIPVLVDGAHAPGQVELNLAALRPAFYTGNLHKWVCAPKGCAFLYVREDWRDRIHPLVTSHGENRRRAGRSLFHDRFDWCGTLDPTPWLCAGDAIRWCDGLLPGGAAALRAANHALVLAARTLLVQALGVEPPCPEEMLGSMAAIPLRPDTRWRVGKERHDPQQEWLWKERQIEVPVMRWGSPERRWLRISAQAYNALPQYDYLASALGESELG